ncbi:hypothetical protein [Streptomyces sp. NPDC093109]|uniref:hypothetical protein n=1 Tax=Streptomyces sp. NPDC093109 TaxID=3154977 RepID=UPI00344ECC7E
MIEQYVKSNGIVVRSHTRLPARARRETAILAAVVVGVFLFASGHTTAGADADKQPEQLRLPRQQTRQQPPAQPQPQPRPTVVYPIERPEWDDSPAVRPTPTVSYPVVFPGPGGAR